MEFSARLSHCLCCPRHCGVDRLAGEAGFCRVPPGILISHAGLHFGEEPPLVGRGGSGTIFFSGCTLGCTFCQNHQISRAGLGREVGTDEFASICLTLQAAGMDWVLLVATQQLRNAFERLRLPMLELAEARAERLGDAGADWGRYYDARPRLICGNLAEGVAYLRGVERPAACTAPDACLAGAP